jgi:hypothetical protein
MSHLPYPVVSDQVACTHRRTSVRREGVSIVTRLRVAEHAVPTGWLPTFGRLPRARPVWLHPTERTTSVPIHTVTVVTLLVSHQKPIPKNRSAIRGPVCTPHPVSISTSITIDRLPVIARLPTDLVDRLVATGLKGRGWTTSTAR